MKKAKQFPAPRNDNCTVCGTSIIVGRHGSVGFGTICPTCWYEEGVDDPEHYVHKFLAGKVVIGGPIGSDGCCIGEVRIIPTPEQATFARAEFGLPSAAE